MKEIKFNKKCDVRKVHKELFDAGFLVISVGNCGNITTVRLQDEETKDPADIVNAHIYVKPPTSKEHATQMKLEFANALDSDEKIIVLAKYLGLL